MDKIKINIDELNTAAETAPEIPRNEDGKIDIDKIAIGKNEKGCYIVPDEIMDRFYRELPPGVVNESGTFRTSPSGGKLRTLGGDPEKDRMVRSMGGKALQANLRQTRTFADAITTLLAQKATKQDINDLELSPDADNLDVVIASMLKQAARGNVKAGEFIRDTIGQKPTDKISAEIEQITPEDRAAIQRILNRENSI